ncbi:MAG: HPt domain-containing protein [Thermocaproicibacter melissae]|jgi:ribosomal protein S27E|uniref:CD1247 N-terminal domain-containing protein n=1 Tax=Thermocaproicibacter melissae TaxID=2966552 RepID=UPI003A0FF9AE
MKTTERVSYVRGLAEGLELDTDKKEVKVINAIIDLLDDMAFSLSEMEGNLNDVIDQVDAIDEDLGSLEDDFYDEGEEEDSDEEDGCFYEVTCPNCNETVCLSEDLVQKGQMKCPNCGEMLEFDLDDIDDECCCDSECSCDENSDDE